MGPKDLSRHKSRTQALIFINRRTQFSVFFKLNKIKRPNLKKFLDLVGAWMELRNY